MRQSIIDEKQEQVRKITQDMRDGDKEARGNFQEDATQRWRGVEDYLKSRGVGDRKPYQAKGREEERKEQEESKRDLSVQCN